MGCSNTRPLIAQPPSPPVIHNPYHGPISVTIRTIGKQFSFQAKSSHTLLEVKRKIFSETLIPEENQSILWEKKQLVNDNATLNECGLSETATLIVWAKKK